MTEANEKISDSRSTATIAVGNESAHSSDRPVLPFGTRLIIFGGTTAGAMLLGGAVGTSMAGLVGTFIGSALGGLIGGSVAYHDPDIIQRKTKKQQ